MPKRILALALVLVLLLSGCAPGQGSSAASFGASSQPLATQTPQPETQPGTSGENLAGSQEYRAMWVSYLEWQSFDFSSAEVFKAGVDALMQNCVDLGLNTVIAQVRPFADALYPSEYFPWSHLCAGVQGEDPGFDPLAILVESAHAHGLALEAWLNPYRVRLSLTRPAYLAENNPALVHPDWVKQVEEGLYFDPSNQQVQQYIVDGVMEVVRNYDVDGIHFDDYFYPTTDPSFDAAEHAAQSGGVVLDEWRRGNVDRLVQAVYSAIKSEKPSVRFGISPQGNMNNNYNSQYSDVALWMSTPGYLDYVLPQLYWGYGYTASGGSTRYAYENITAEWAQLPRAPSVALYFGLGAYRLGDGDGGSNSDAVTQWQTGDILARMVETGRQAGGQGYVLYRYDNLYQNTAWPQLAASELAALKAVNG